MKLSGMFKNKLTWVFTACLLLAYLIHFSEKMEIRHIVSSDGDGYYAYLPAVFLYNDPSFESCKHAQNAYNEKENNSYFYLLKTKNGKTVNKYFPGVALMQSPAFLLATLSDKLVDGQQTGYSDLYFCFFYFFSLLYLFIGLRFAFKALEIYAPESRKYNTAAFITVFFGTNLFFNCLAFPSFSHVYSFFLFSTTWYVFLRYLANKDQKLLWILGILIGLIFVVRPTNLIFVLFLAFFFDSQKGLLAFIRELFSGFRLARVLLPFLALASLPLWLNYWQTGTFFEWSYKGEGFNFGNPRIFENLFSYRIGMFVHHPVLWLGLVGLFFLYRENKYRFVVWLLYFGLSSYVVSSWWCWDYESSFGNRGFSDHFLIFIFPILAFFRKLKMSYVVLLLLPFLAYGTIRFYQKITGIFPRQKFTRETYWKSFSDLSKDSKDRYHLNLHCEPFGTIKKRTLVYSHPGIFEFNTQTEFGLGTTVFYPQNRLSNRFFYDITFEKQISGNNWKNVLLVIDSHSKQDSSRFYFTQPVYTDFREGNSGNWIKHHAQEEIPLAFEQKDSTNLFFWNPDKKSFRIRNLNVYLYEYEAD